MYEIFERLCRERGVSVYRVSEATGIKTSSFSGWKAGKFQFKTEKLKRIADYFGVPIEYLMTGEEPTNDSYYLDAETKELAQDLHDNADLKMLLDAARDCTPEQLKLLRQLADSWDKGEK